MSRVPEHAGIACRRAQFFALKVMFTVPIYAWLLGVARHIHGPRGFAPGVPLGVLRVGLAVLALIDLLMIPRLVSGVLDPPAPPAGGASTAISRLRTASVLAMAMCEAIALLGFALALLGGQSRDFYAFALLSLAAFVWHFPRRSAWEARLRELPRA